jgi:HEAT repeat protein
MRPYYPDAVRVSVVLLVLVATPGLTRGQQGDSAAKLVQEFKNERVVWRQFGVGKKIVSLRDTSVLRELEPFLNDEDRQVRGNAGFVFASLGDDRGFETIKDILNDTSYTSTGRSGAKISSDRYYAAHLLGDLRDKRAVPILIPLLDDGRVNAIVPWALGEIGDKAAIPPLIQALSDKHSDMRVLAIYALVTLKATEALPKLHLLLDDNEKIHFDGQGTVADAARGAIPKLDGTP